MVSVINGVLKEVCSAVRLRFADWVRRSAKHGDYVCMHRTHPGQHAWIVQVMLNGA